MGYNVLILEDNKIDAELMREYLVRSDESFDMIRIVHDKEKYEELLQISDFDLILSDYRLVDFDGAEAIQMKNKYCEEVPIIIVSGTIGEEKAVEVIKGGAIDFLMKNNIEKRLAQMSMRAIREANEKKRRKEVEESLKQSEQKYRLLTENSTDMISRHTPDGEYLYISPASYDLMGYEPEELIGTSVFDYIHPDDIEAKKKSRENAIKSLEKYQVSYRMKCKNGKWLWVESIDKVLREPKTGEVFEIQASTRDISERKKYEQDLEQESKLNNNILSSLPGIFFLVDKEGAIQRSNSRLKNILGYVPEENENQPFVQFISYEDRENLLAGFTEAFENGFMELEVNLRTPEGKNIPYLLTGIVGTLKGEEYLLGTGIDIEDRKTFENELKKEKKFIEKAINSLPGLFYVMDQEKNYVRVNDDFLESLGYSKDEFQDMETMDFYLEKDHTKVKKAIDKAFSKGVSNFVTQLKTKEGDLPHYYITGSLFHEAGENFILGTGIDITDRIRAEEMIQKSLNEKELLLMEIHHRVKNNLALISGILQLHASKSGNDVVIDHLTNSQSRIKSIAIVHELLYETHNFSNIPLNKNLEKLIEHVSSTIQADTEVNWDLNMESVEVNVNQAIPCALIVNEVITNIFKHAFKGKKKGKVKVLLKVKNKKAIMKISDDGIGMPNEISTDNSDNLGMTLIKTLSEQLKGDFEYKKEKEGTVFKLTFEKMEIKGGASHFFKENYDE